MSGTEPKYQRAPQDTKLRKIYRDAISDGRGVVEIDNPKAIQEIEALAKEIYGG